ncbi:MAG: zinc-ribbon domain-containing protein [Eubacterium sp.]|nr:zinc-ribbon domain-containing protein [Eubacterium sp.]
MPFCKNCGNELENDAKFCTNCGSTITRQTMYDGIIHKCPNCGEVLPSFVTNCPSCGYELRGTTATSSIVTFYKDLNNTQSVEQRSNMIRNFPIPNAKEDIIEFMVLASSNISGENNKDISKAWLAKFEQCYQKALITFNTSADRDYIEQIYRDCQAKIENEKNKQITKLTFETVTQNIIVGVGLVLLLIAIRVEKNEGNSSVYELISSIVLIASSASLLKRNAAFIDYIVAAISGLLLIGSSYLFNNGSMLQLSGMIVLIIVAVNYFKSLFAKNRR